ncbi:MAG: hypothetical protein NWE92_10860 [Candidatus Bathyarchaeota archaeon]|nr:hypothetical protein [Candidatus Bathyarchaeota archaeon]
MQTLGIRVNEFSGYLQSLASSEYCKKVEEAVEKKDHKSLVTICRKAKIPSKYTSAIVSTLMHMATPQQKYPEWI